MHARTFFSPSPTPTTWARQIQASPTQIHLPEFLSRQSVNQHQLMISSLLMILKEFLMKVQFSVLASSSLLLCQSLSVYPKSFLLLAHCASFIQTEYVPIYLLPDSWMTTKSVLTAWNQYHYVTVVWEEAAAARIVNHWTKKPAWRRKEKMVYCFVI